MHMQGVFISPIYIYVSMFICVRFSVPMTSFNTVSQILTLKALILSSRRSFRYKRVLLIKFKQDVLIEPRMSQVFTELRVCGRRREMHQLMLANS